MIKQQINLYKINVAPGSFFNLNRTMLIVRKNTKTCIACLPLPLATIPSIDWMKKQQRKHRRRLTMMKHPNQKDLGWNRKHPWNFHGSFQLKTHHNFKTLFWLIHICALDIKNIARTSLWALRYKNTSKLA